MTSQTYRWFERVEMSGAYLAEEARVETRDVGRHKALVHVIELNEGGS